MARTGLHFLIPIVVLLWCLMFEGMSPALSVFWATVDHHRHPAHATPLIALFRGGRALVPAFRQSVWDLVDGLELGARNMIGIGIATATAGIVVGTMTLTGMSQRMTDLVEVISAGNVLAMLVLTAAICLVIGLGIPTTASYILVAVADGAGDRRAWRASRLSRSR